MQLNKIDSGGLAEIENAEIWEGLSILDSTGSCFCLILAIEYT